MKSTLKYFIVLLLLQVPPSYAQESLPSIMARMSPKSAIRIRYQETRYMQLMDKPWQGSGYFYVNPERVMVREQIKPERELMAVQQTQMFYFNPTHNRRYQSSIDAKKPLGFQITSFQALVNGNLARLQSLYQTSLQTNQKGWSLTLIPKQTLGDESLVRVLVAGRNGEAVQTIKLYQQDGDYSETRLSEDVQDSGWQKHIDRLLVEVRGQ